VNEYNIDWSSGQVPDFKFNGKELDEENGMYYFEARYQSPPVFISRDPLFEKYPTLSPYSYCANNPLRYIDPTGEDLEITGEAAGEATQQLENKTSKRFNLIRNENGSIRYEGRARSRNDKLIKEVIDNQNIKVNIVANNSDNFTAHDGQTYSYAQNMSGDVVGGAYGGSTVSEENKINAYQYVNPQQLAHCDKSVGDSKTGGYMLHELAEGYESGKMACWTGVGDAVGGNRYKQLHQKANAVSVGDFIRVYEATTVPNLFGNGQTTKRVFKGYKRGE
jgi:RHS repeat-associated protein